MVHRLGLTITRQLIELLNGSITLTVSLDKVPRFSRNPLSKGKTYPELISRNTVVQCQPLSESWYPAVKTINNQRVLFIPCKVGTKIDIAENGNECIRMLDKKNYDVLMICRCRNDGFEQQSLSGAHERTVTKFRSLQWPHLRWARKRPLFKKRIMITSQTFNAADLQNKIQGDR